MRVVRRINNNAIVCRDTAGHEVIAMGKGISFAVKDGEVPLSAIERTFYDLDEHYVALLDEVSPELLGLSADIVDVARSEISRELSSSLALTLADHISFALRRLQRGIAIQMPFASHIAQSYPTEYRLGMYARKRIEQELDVDFPEDEGAGIAMCFINAICGVGTAHPLPAADAKQMLRDITACVERRMEVSVDRESFAFARFSTHVRYLLQRAGAETEQNEENIQMFQLVSRQAPAAAACVDDICHMLDESWGFRVREDEKLYLLLHINRMLANDKH